MIAKLFEELRGGITKNAFSERLGISRRMLNMLYNQERGIGPKTLRNLVRVYPEHREQIMGVFFNQNVLYKSHNGHDGHQEEQARLNE